MCRYHLKLGAPRYEHPTAESPIDYPLILLTPLTSDNPERASSLNDISRRMRLAVGCTLYALALRGSRGSLPCRRSRTLFSSRRRKAIIPASLVPRCSFVRSAIGPPN